MIHACEHLTGWLAQGNNAAAIEALATVFSTVFTIVLVVITWRYVRITAGMSLVAAKQLISQFQPQLGLSVDRTTSSGEMEFTVVNEGPRPIQVFGINIGLPFPDHFDQEKRVRVSAPGIRILAPREKMSASASIPSAHLADYRAHEFNNITLYVDCADFNAIGMHCYTYNRDMGLQYFDSFKTLPLPRGTVVIVPRPQTFTCSMEGTLPLGERRTYFPPRLLYAASTNLSVVQKPLVAP